MKPRPGIAIVHPAALAATWFGCGLLPKAPGTWGSMAALIIAWPIVLAFGPLGLALAAVICFFAGWWASAIYVRRTGVQDPQEIVIDEVAGQWLVLAATPPDLVFFALGFLLFRLLDITKPFPAGWADRTLGGGLGVMADDVLAAMWGAGLMALAAIWLGR